MSSVQEAGRAGTANGPKRISLGPMDLDCLTLDGAVQRIEAAVQAESECLHVVTANAQFLGLARKSPVFANVIRNARLVVPDGMPLIWLCRLQKATPGARITGHDLLHACAELAASRGYRIGFLGGAPGVAEQAASRLIHQYPGLHIAGCFNGMFNQDGSCSTVLEEREMIEAMRSAKPHMLFVALGCPKQEMWIARHQQAAGVPVAIGVGGVLDVLAGRFKRAPQWMQRSGLEWLYRLGQDPSRLAKRYLLQDVPTLTAGAFAAFRERSQK